MKTFPKILKALITKIRRKLGLLTKYEKEEIIKRQELCKTCPFNSRIAVEKGLYKTNRLDLHCMFCGCTIDIFTYCLECTCSIEEENKKNNYKLPIKWFPI